MANLTGERWKRIRGFVTPTFSGVNMKRMKPFFDDAVQTLLKNFEDARLKSDEVLLKNMYGAFTLDTLFQVCVLKQSSGFKRHQYVYLDRIWHQSGLPRGTEQSSYC